MKRKPKIKVKERKLGRERSWGLAYQGLNLIELDPRMRSKMYLIVLIHEVLHIIYPEMSESKVDKHSRIIANEVWNRGYRRIMK